MPIYKGGCYCLLFFIQEEERVCTGNLVLKQSYIPIQTYPAWKLLTLSAQNHYGICRYFAFTAPRDRQFCSGSKLWQMRLTQIGTNNRDRCGHARVSLVCSFKVQKSTVWATITPRWVSCTRYKRWVLFLQNPNRICHFLTPALMTESQNNLYRERLLKVIQSKQI